MQEEWNTTLSGAELIQVSSHQDSEEGSHQGLFDKIDLEIPDLTLSHIMPLIGSVSFL